MPKIKIKDTLIMLHHHPPFIEKCRKLSRTQWICKIHNIKITKNNNKLIEK